MRLESASLIYFLYKIKNNIMSQQHVVFYFISSDIEYYERLELNLTILDVKTFYVNLTRASNCL